ncbi:hypothetical protein BX661DRAFT_177678 [Kickxella alabastrina]|uniref:uncharacterized protein n=1 Tax=Kickxella alabastrina TaxID=61397 RepID=UPI00221F3E0A|nr:uncharacterized protein BX661DRAFT_177678 [Kickxella alabastrina]KAI7833857.1 hypothetical protein BX661DRAFT_177678 [Kickxella alabastrina]
MALAPALFPGRMDPVHQQDVLWEPPYARLLRRLGLFDPLELPPKGASTFPVAAYSARASQQMPQQQDDKYQLGYPRDDAERPSNWHYRRGLWRHNALGGGKSVWPLRDAMDRIERKVHDSNCRYYHVSTYTMPDGSVETRKVVRNKDGSETTTVTRHGRDSTASDQVTATTTPALTPGDLSSAK